MLQKIQRFVFAAGTVLLILILAGSVTYTFAQNDEEDDGEVCTAETCGIEEEIEAPITPACTQDTWDCSSWSTCSADGSQTRTCTLSSDCESVSTPKPSEKRNCVASKTVTESPQAPPPPPPPVIEKSPPSLPPPPPPPPPPVTEKKTPAQKPVQSPKVSETTAPQSEKVTPLSAVPQELSFTKEKESNITYQEESIKKTAALFKVNPTITEAITKVPTDQNFDTDRDGLSDKVDPAPLNNDINRNGIPDGIEKLSGKDPTKPDPEEKQFEAELTKQKETLIASGATPEQAEKKVVTIVHQKRVERKVRLIRAVAQNVYNIQILSNTQDSNQDGVSDEFAVELGIDPKAPVPVTAGDLSPADLKLLKTTPELASKKCSLNVYSGSKLASRGFTILGACPKNKEFTLFIIDQSGKEFALATEQSSDNYKIVFTISNSLRSGTYLLQIRPKTGGAGAASEPVMVSLVDDEELAINQPVVKKIEDVDVVTLKDIKITRTKDGRIHVSGVSDTSSVVVGTFESAVFNSALLADTKSGSFEIVSSKPLDLGDHAVTIYATRSGEAAQSRPVKVPFSIIEVARAAGPEIEVVEQKKTSPLPLVAGGAAVVILLAALIAWGVTRKKKKTV